MAYIFMCEPVREGDREGGGREGGTRISNSNDTTLCVSESAHPAKHSGCFPAEATVVAESGEVKRMQDLKVGETVRSVGADGGLGYSEVIMFLDREPEKEVKFVRVTTDGGAELVLTATHLVHAAGPGCDHISCFSAVFAGSLSPGLRVMVEDGGGGGELGPQTVVGLETVVRKGVFAPLTRSGNLVVDGVLASCYAVIDSQAAAHAAFGPVRWYANLRENAGHLWRTLSGPLGGGAVARRTRVYEPDRTGVHWYADLLYTLAGYLLPPHLLA